MRRARKHHEQQELFPKRGGARKNAGRPPKGKRSSEPHKRRAGHKRSNPVHVTMRVVDGLGSLRKRDTFSAIREATAAVLHREDFRIVYLSIQRNHIHMLVEAHTKSALSRGVQGFEIAAARHINRALSKRNGEKRRGGVFADRYHSNELTSPRAVRHALAYVLNNWRRHREDERVVARDWKLDPYANSVDFPGWRELADSPTLYRPPKTYVGLNTWLPKTWLLKVGWQKHGLISVYDVPGPEPKNQRRSTTV